ncbi:DsbA family protein [Proteiniclasticum sp. QWL-01]|uniref:DsbA family protein n=1 Tax=Proteiniclasticum sp. QWL-01 TaxID=3036945 RepID=UPI002410C17C|nr:DsbA family protein [Proteiniclasticum sp. QWL-01]WFF73640.1 DsbA family protein [Proteiniclasticum sp. QWL-01]
MEKQPMACDVELGTCDVMTPMSDSVPATEGSATIQLPESSKAIQMIYVTDPLCCYCWQAEPALRKFTALYGQHFDSHILMGGLLESWDGFSDEGNDIRQPKDVGIHWREAAAQFGMPIDGTLWDKDPVRSSYPASILFKLVQQISDTSSRRFLRSIREEVMVKNRNISRDDVLANVLDLNDRNGRKMVEDMKTTEARALLNQDLTLSRQLGATSFPTVIFLKEGTEGIRVAGLQDFETYEQALLDIAGEELEAAPLPELKDMFKLSRTIFFREIEVMYDLEPEAVEAFIQLNLPEDSYEIKEHLNSRYIVRK